MSSKQPGTPDKAEIEAMRFYCDGDRDDERADVLDLLNEWLAHYPADLFPSAADGGDITGNAGAAARHVLGCLIEQIEKGEHIGRTLNNE